MWEIAGDGKRSRNREVEERGNGRGLPFDAYG